jgi:hypothetical protein
MRHIKEKLFFDAIECAHHAAHSIRSMLSEENLSFGVRDYKKLQRILSDIESDMHRAYDLWRKEIADNKGV